ncbi:serine/threonine kinase 17 [Sarotherodon galilaeus]
MIVPVWVSSEQHPGTEKLVYALLDTQSDTVFIDQDVSNNLQAKATPIRLKLTTLLGKDVVVPSERISGLKVRGYNSSEMIELPPAYTKECIPVNRSHIPTCETARRWNHLKEIRNEIPPQLECEVGLLIGYSCSKALAPKQVILGGENEPYAVRTALGWSIVGPTSSYGDSSSMSTVCHRVAVKELPLVTPADVIKVLESDFKDNDKDNKSVSQDDILFLNMLKEGIYKNTEGHYEMPLPFKERPLLPDNKQMATVRLQSLKTKLSKDQRYKEQYIKFMSEILEKGDAEEVQNEAKEGERWFIPHHGIYHPQKPDKLRVVFDASAKYRGTSLNDHLLSGPDLLNSLNGVLIRFRRHQVALLCDIEKMFHQFHVYEADRDYLRFLWWKNGAMNTEPQEFRMKVHLFGATSSPGCANYGLKHLAKENETQFPLASQFIMKDFYVDDGVTSTASIKEAIQLAQEAQTLCASGGLRLHKFVSNNKTVLESIPASERASPQQACDLAFNDSKLERALGIHWHIGSDTLRFRFRPNVQPATRRGILSMVASLYDPLGFISPFVLTGKRVLQETCKQGTGWDDPLPSELRPMWDNWNSDLKNLEKIVIPRCYVPKDFGPIVKTELHHFSDTSSYGYGQCSYLRHVNKDDKVHCALVTAKTRVAPIKVTTIPRLELTAAVVSITVSNMLKDELGLTQIEEYFWTDSKVVLGYINNDARRFHTFVSNRVQRIRLNSSPQQWRYVPSEENPPDIASRGSGASELIISDWFKGPQFLWEKEIPPPADIDMNIPLGDPEVKKVQALNMLKTEKKGLSDKLTKFSSWYKATQAIARLIRCAKGDKTTGHSTVQERQNAQCVILKDTQASEYAEEIRLLKNGKPLPHKSKLFQMDTFLDTDGLLKVGGRLKDASFSSILKHPVIVPKGHHVTQLIIDHFHSKVQHQGKGFTINEIRVNGFWIPGINKAVANFIHQCVKCRKLRRGTEEQKMSDLPTQRLDPSPPFTFCGMDCFGPFLTKQARKEHKRYGLLFTCLCCRAVHIEMLDNMTTDAFINALRCFIAIRGAVSEIRCDQGSNFVGAKNELQEGLKQVDSNRITTFLAEKQCDFKMHTPHSSHTGGVWERQIRTVRNILRSTVSLSSGRMDDTSLRTFFYEAMAIVNSRPLTVDNLSDPSSPEPLTPNHLLTMKSKISLPPPGTFIKEDIYARKRWRQVQYLSEQFWSRWKREYLSNIATRQKWHTPRRNLKVGDVVMEKMDDLPRNEWRLARVMDTVTDKDGLVRKVRICFGQKGTEKGQCSSKCSIVERPVQKLVLLLETV